QRVLSRAVGVAVRDLPDDVARVHVVGGDTAVRRLHQRETLRSNSPRTAACARAQLRGGAAPPATTAAPASRRTPRHRTPRPPPPPRPAARASGSVPCGAGPAPLGAAAPAPRAPAGGA